MTMKIIELPADSADFMTSVAEHAERNGMNWNDIHSAFQVGMGMYKSEGEISKLVFRTAREIVTYQQILSVVVDCTVQDGKPVIDIEKVKAHRHGELYLRFMASMGNPIYT